MKKSLITLALLGTLGLSANAFAYEAGDIVVRAGLTSVSPDDSTSTIIAGGNDLGVDLTVGSDIQIGLNLAYFLTDKINVELLAATPFNHKVSFGVANPLGTGDVLGDVTHLPPTLSVNYYLLGADAPVQPYVGLGLNYTIFFDEEFTEANDGAGLTNLDLDSSFGLAVQIGADFQVNDKVHVNMSLRYIDIETEANFNVGDAAGSVGEIAIDPLVATVSVGYKF